jgi:hypothetical protein
MSATGPTMKDVLDALLSTVEGNDFDDDLGGWWNCVHLGDALYLLSFTDADGINLGRWEVVIEIQPSFIK